MKVQDNIGKITWSFLDKFIVILYGFVTLYQMKHLDPIEFGYFSSVLVLVNYILTLSDSFALQGLIQFGSLKDDIKKVNAISFILHVSIVVGLPLIIMVIQTLISKINGSTYLDKYIIFLPIMALSSIPRAFALKLLSRELLFKEYFFVNLIFFSILSIFPFYFIFKYNDLNALLLIQFYIIASIFSSIYAFLSTKKLFKLSLNGDFKFREYIKFSTPMTLTSFFHSIPKFLDLFIISLTFPPKTAEILIGVYSSAKTLFRLFEQVVEASYGLLYPTTIKNIAKNNKDGIISLYSKGVSFVFVLFLITFLILNFGLTDYIFKFLPIKYSPAIGYFNLMTLATLFLPFGLVSILITASGKAKVTLYFVSSASICSLFTFLIVGLLQKSELLPLGIIIYYVIFGFLSFYYFKKNYGFPISRLFRAFSDTSNFIKSKTK